MKQVSLKDIAESAGVSLSDLDPFFVAYGISPSPQTFTGEEATRVRVLFAEWRERPKLVPMRLVAAHFGVEPTQFLKWAHECGLSWLRSESARMTQEHAHQVSDWITRFELAETAALIWPPALESSALAGLSALNPIAEFEELAVEESRVEPTALHAALVRLAEAELQQKATKHNYFLLRLIDHMSTDPIVSRHIREEGLLLSDLRFALSLVDDVPMPRSGHTFVNDVFWAVARSRWSNLTTLWVADGTLPTARLMIREPARPRPERGSRQVDARDAYSVGEIRWVQLHESKRGIRSELHHPAVIVEKAGANKWRVVSLTSNIEGDPEGRRVPRAAEQGLAHSGYVWHESQKVFVSEIGDHIGWVHPELVEVIRRSVRIRTSLVEELALVAAAKHPNLNVDD